MSQIQSLSDWPTGPVLPLGEHLQEGVTALRKLSEAEGLDLRNKDGVVLGHRWVGVVQNSGPNGESDYDDARYWVSRQIADASDDPSDPVQFITDINFDPHVYTCTNLVEYSPDGGGHSLVTNGTVYVRVDGWIDQNNVLRWTFYAIPPRPFFCRLSVHAGSNGSVSGGTVTNADYTYDLLHPDTGDVIDDTGLAPDGSPTNRAQGPLTGPATSGTARLNPDGTSYTLISCNEHMAAIACPT